MQTVVIEDLGQFGFGLTYIDDAVGDFDLDGRCIRMLDNYSVSAGETENYLDFGSLGSVYLGQFEEVQWRSKETAEAFASSGYEMATGFYVWWCDNAFYLGKIREDRKCEVYSKETLEEVLDLLTSLMDKDPEVWKNRNP